MQEFLYTMDAILPMMILIALGYMLKVLRLFDEAVTKGLNKFTFIVSIPVLVFYNIYNIEKLVVDTNLIIFSVVSILVLFFLGILFNRYFKTSDRNKSVMLQNFFRTNTSTMGLQVVAVMGISIAAQTNVAAMVGISIATFNMLGVIAFQIYNKSAGKIKIGKLLISIITNPIIVGVLCGFGALGLRAIVGYHWLSENLSPVFIAVKEVAKVSSPVALIALGASFTFSSFKELKKEIIAGVLIRTVIVPAIIFGIAIGLKDVLGFNENHFPALVVVMLPSLAVATAPMADSMNGNSKLAAQLIVWTTIASSITMFVVIYILKVLMLV
ncbi:AEC family transporter [Acholeplasma hippikon]|uniref:Membrane transport protein n=1 Tax=Acholeplasma hippikon TaxID=264636 RepID=A0A449BK97_9MOLU|nr:AEC family transporter [Acholeplasma hippikon]VEU82850.1 Membrane transport protein [Acholeplasma hippikon]